MRKVSTTLLLFLISSTALAGNTGKVAGRVTDAATKEALIGANVVIVGTTLGASADLDGKYAILNIPPGVYTIRASAVGYGPKEVQNVRVSIDLTTEMNFELAEAAVQAEVVVIVAERRFVQKDLTAKTAVVGKDDLAALPVTEFSQVLNLQAGFVAGSLRGGRKGEVAYWIDGVPITDVYDGSQVIEVNKNLIEEVQLISGAYNAEYGQAMSGIVNIATKEGGKSFSGGVGLYGGDYASNRTDIFPGIDQVKPTAIRNAEFNLSGPITGENLSFFVNGRYIYFDGWRKGIRRFNPSNIALYDSTGTFNLFRDPSGRGDGSIVPMNWSERKYGQAKLTWRIASQLKLNYDFIYDHRTEKSFDKDPFARYSQYTFNPDGIGKTITRSATGILQVTHTLSQSTFYTLGASLFDKDLNYYVYEDPHDPHYVHPKLQTRDDPFSFLTGGTDLERFHRSTKTVLVKLDLSSQIDASNLVKLGVELRRHKVFLESITLQPIQQQSDINLAKDSPFIKTEIPDLSSNFHNMYEHKPMEYSAYIQDKMEFKDLIINWGVRFDYFEPDGVVLADESDPSIYNPIKPSNRFNDRNGDGVQDAGELTKTVEERRAYWYKKAKAKRRFSPRLGAAFPITDRGVVHFSYGHFFQIPRFERLYENPDFKLGFGTGNQGVVGNADLSPEQTINGELGIQQQLTDDIGIDLTAYIRDIRNLAGTRADEIVIFGGSAKYSKYVNSDFGFVKGIVFSLDKRFSNKFSARVDYTYQVAHGSASDPQQARNARAGGALPEVQLTPLDWDQRHTLNATLTYSGGSWGLSFIGQYGTGTPYTPRRSTDITALLTNSQSKPQFINLDARAFYEIRINPFKLVVFVRAFNLLDRKNEVGVFDDTGRASFTTDEARTRALNTAQHVNSLDEFFRSPGFYSEPRRIEFGMNIEF